MKPTLVVLAAGMGSRYGGLKQVDPVGPSGEAILDYSVFDALRGGFGKVVFVIRRDFEAEFKEKIGRKFEALMPVDYCYQDIADLPAPYTVPAGRTKPWGTAHATRAARSVVDGPFAVINADDFYGRDAFAKLAEFLVGSSSVGVGPNSVGAGSSSVGVGSAATLTDANSTLKDPKLHIAMVGFRLDLTLSENGSVARGICDIAPDGKLRGVTEMTKLVKVGDIAENREDEANPVKVPLDSRVSMNFWGFPAGLFAELEERFPKWLAVNGSKEKSEWYIPFVVDELVREGKADCCVLPTDSSWFGVTYRDDKPRVMESIRALVDAGEYPSNLFA
ncbi:MAG: nucleotidyltransferase [Kiritimatiellae bacterium]|nr:nucleotidyltransferase [Kiritimatiellia bacterium]